MPARGGAGRPGQATRASLSVVGGAGGGGAGSCWPPFLCRGGGTGGAGPSAGPLRTSLSLSVLGGEGAGPLAPLCLCRGGGAGPSTGHRCLCKGQEWTQSHGPSFAVPLFLASSEVPKKPLKTISPGICLCRVYGHPLCTAK